MSELEVQVQTVWGKPWVSSCLLLLLNFMYGGGVCIAFGDMVEMQTVRTARRFALLDLLLDMQELKLSLMS